MTLGSTLFAIWISLVCHDAARVIQSTRCTPEERQNHIQCFDVLPLEQYAVPLGSTVNMQCVVLNQHGKVQWRAKKILLGYDRSIPGYSRYRIIGDVSRGEHTLQIMDVQLNDAGEYECQVTPVPANNHPLLRRKTKLLVLIKPSHPRILYPDIPPPDNQLIISQPDPITRITVLCVTSGGSPPPVFTWQLNNREIPANFAQNPKQARRPDQAFWMKLAPVIHAPSNEGESRISLLKAGLNDGDQLTCSITNEATRTHHDPQQHNLTTVVTIRVHTPPGPPRIISPKSNQEYLEGEELKAVCTASPPGNPFGGLFWRWLIHPAQIEESNTQRIIGMGGHGGARLSDYSSVQNYLHSSMTGDPNQRIELISEDVQPLHYKLNKHKDQLINTLIIPRISRRYHAAKLVCETGHPVGNAQQTSVTIYVKYPPANVTIEVEGGRLGEQMATRRRENVVYGRAGETKTLICRTSPYFRQASIKWIWQSADTNFDRTPRQLIGQSKSIRTPDGESWYQESRVDVQFTERDDRSYVDCRVWGEGDSRIDERVRLDIIYPPDPPVITGYESLKPIKMAHALELKCITTGGNPPPTLLWYRDKNPLVSQEDIVVIGRQASLRIRIIPQKDDNGAHYHCAASNAATDQNGVVSEPVILNVLFPPQRVSIGFHGRSVVSTGQPLVVECQADSSNPIAVITWWHYRCGPASAFQDDVSSIVVLKGGAVADSAKCKSVQLEGTEEKPTPGAAGGLQAHSRLWLRPTWKYHMDYIECRAENLEYGPPVWHDRLQLNITFAPQFLGLQNRKEYVIREGQTLNVDLGPYANPPVSFVKWYSHGQQLPNQPVHNASIDGVFAAGQSGELLALNRIKREHMGNYTVVAGNDIGQSSEVFFLNVTFPPSFLGNAEENVTETSGDTAELHCEIMANPAVASDAFTWYRYVPPRGWPQDVNEAAVELSPGIRCNHTSTDKLSIACQQHSNVRIGSTLHVQRITRDEVGTYICEVNNGLSDPIRKRIHLIYPFTPTIIQLPRYTKAAGEQGSVVTLTCLIRTEPTPQVGWLKNHRLLDPRDVQFQNKYRLQFDHIRPGLYKSTLTLNNLQKHDFGVYHCQAVNIKGEAVLEVQLSGTSTPDVPLNLRLLNSTTNSLRVAWTQGFDGGLTQTFQVRWKQAGEPSMFKYADVAANDNHHAVEYLITGLESGTEYLVSVNSMNAKHGSSGHTDFIHVRTESFDRHSNSQLIPPLSSAGPSDDNAILIIVAACVFGFVILIINLVVITFLVKRKKQRRMLIRQSKMGKANRFGTTLANGFAMSPTGTRMDPYGMQDSKMLDDTATEHLMKSSDSDQRDGCACFPQSRSKPCPRMDFFEPYARENGHVGQSFGHSDFRRFSAQTPNMGFRIPISDGLNDFSHVDPLASGFPLSQSYQGSDNVDQATVLHNPRVTDSPLVRQPSHPNMSNTPQSLFGMSKEPSVAFERSRSSMLQFGKSFHSGAINTQSRYGGIPVRLSHDCLNYGDHRSLTSRHQSLTDLFWTEPFELKPSITRDSCHAQSGADVMPRRRHMASDPRSVNTFISSSRLSEPHCQFTHQRKNASKVHNPMRFSDAGYLSDFENGYDRDLYAQELRRMQYGHGPAAELLLHNGTPNKSNIHRNKNKVDCHLPYKHHHIGASSSKQSLNNGNAGRQRNQLFLNPNGSNLQTSFPC